MFDEIEILSVSQLTKQIKLTLEEEFPQISVLGEISNFKAHVSGHWYFNLKDSEAVISCTMWKGINNYVFFNPQDGMKIIITGRITVYPPRGNYQFDVRSMKPAGIGELQVAFEKLKKKLSEEGLFDESFKKPIPQFPEKIGIVTAIDGAAFQDMINIASRRFPLVELVIAPSKVQGAGAAESIVNSLKLLNKQNDVDVIILGRGGGSIEDLWAFNEEIVARAIFASKIPIISAVGHEIDFTIADFVADLRAPTPSAAMELATPHQEDIFAFINDFSYTSTQNIKEFYLKKYDSVQNILKSYGFRMPLDLVRRKSQQLDNVIYKISNGINRKFLFNSNKLSLIIKTIESYDTKRILKKGFALVKQDSKYIKRVSQFDRKKLAAIEFYDGSIEVSKIN
jgi:exodeoxyribonuclease VII large subunit